MCFGILLWWRMALTVDFILAQSDIVSDIATDWTLNLLTLQIAWGIIRSHFSLNALLHLFLWNRIMTLFRVSLDIYFIILFCMPCMKLMFSSQLTSLWCLSIVSCIWLIWMTRNKVIFGKPPKAPKIVEVEWRTLLRGWIKVKMENTNPGMD